MSKFFKNKWLWLVLSFSFIFPMAQSFFSVKSKSKTSHGTFTDHKPNPINQPPKPMLNTTPNLSKARSTSQRVSRVFNRFSQTVPSLDDLKSLSGHQLHHTPQPIIDAAAQLGTIYRLQKQHPEKANQFLSFYSECVFNEQHPAIIRALCLEKYQLMHQDPKILHRLPKLVVAMYRRLPTNQ